MSIDRRYLGFLGKASVPLPIALLLLGSCSTGPIVCPADEPEFAVQVSFYDAVAQQRLLGPTPGVIEEGSYRDSLRVFAFDLHGAVASMAAGRGREGTYRLTAKRDGYGEYSRSNIRVESAGCGVIPVRIDAQLQPE